jgi:hypothetical protein
MSFSYSTFNTFGYPEELREMCLWLVFFFFFSELSITGDCLSSLNSCLYDLALAPVQSGNIICS